MQTNKEDIEQDFKRYIAIVKPTTEVFREKLVEQFGNEIKLRDAFIMIERITGILLSGMLAENNLDAVDKDRACHEFCLNLAIRMKDINKISIPK